jgi:hypothetical protein
MSAVFHPIRRRSQAGDAQTCGDNKVRVAHPGVPFDSVDGEEGCALTTTRAALANYPCPKCLVHHDELHNIDGCFKARTAESMKRVYDNAINAVNKTEAERILQDYGIHKTEVLIDFKSVGRIFTKSRLQNFFWSMAHSDPYRAFCYDKLHSDDGGKWGKHGWPLILKVLGTLRNKGSLTQKYVSYDSRCAETTFITLCSMAKVARWQDLKHFRNVTTIEYTDGQSFLDILKVRCSF